MAESIISWLSLHYIELAGTVSGILGAWLTTRQLIWCWPVSIINVIAYIIVFYMARLYADFGLQFFYLALSIFGWYNWIFGGQNKQKLKVSRMTIRRFIVYFIAGTALVLILGTVLKHYTNAALPYLDSFLSVWSIICTWLMARKILESWIIWIIVDSTYIGMYVFKELYLTAFLYLLYTSIAIYGFIEWKKDFRKEKPAVSFVSQ